MNLYRALKYRNCRLFFPGLLLSQIGIWYQNIAISWIVLGITKSALLTGTITFLNTLPLFVITPIAGVITDKYDKQKLLFVIQVLFALQALFLTIFALLGHLNLLSIVILGFLLNSIIAIDTPLRQSIFASLVDDKKDLTNAIALNSACFNAARLIGPAAAGLILYSYGATNCFLINFILVIPAIILISMLSIKAETQYSPFKEQSIIEGLKTGLKYVKQNKTILNILISLIFISLIGMTYPLLLSIYTKNYLNLDSNILGLLMASTGFGALCSSFILASKRSLKGLKNVMTLGILVFGLSFICLSFAKTQLLAMLFSFFLGSGMTASITGINTIFQSLVEDNKRGRLMSLYAICYLGSSSLSNLLAGSTSEYFGITKTFIIFGLILSTISYIVFRKLRRL